jgi:hypothetical protein
MPLDGLRCTIYIPSLIKIGSGTENLLGDTYTDTQTAR